MKPGKVYLVGAGPGDPELITLKGRRALEEADVVVYDRLANPALLELARPGVERIFVGKEPQCHPLPQPDINLLLVERARAGQVVCRLKGGDPFLFGRGGEEALTLSEEGIPWEYVPGVTSAIAVPGYAGIPVTHRGLCGALTIVTGHADPADPASADRWRAQVMGSDTLVFLMGVERLPRLVERLLEAGRSPDTPAAVVSWGTYPRQRTVEAPLGSLAERCREAGIEAPAVTIVGEVCALRASLRWFDASPLFGRRIVVTRPRQQSAPLEALLSRQGATPVPCPSIAVRPLREVDLAVLERPFDWVVFTSVNGVGSLVDLLRSAGRDVRALGPARIAAIGPETAAAADRAGLRVDHVPPQYVAESLLESFPVTVQGCRILIPRAREARDVLPATWRDRGAEVVVLPVYETIPDEAGAAALREALGAAPVDALTFTASSTVRSFLELAVAAGVPRAMLESIPAACIGPVTAATAREAGFSIVVSAETHTTLGLVDALGEYFSSEAGTSRSRPGE